MLAKLDIQRIPHNFRDNTLLSPDFDAMSAYITSQSYYFEEHHQAVNITSPASYGIGLYGNVLFTSEEMIDWIKEHYYSNLSRNFLRHEAKIINRMIGSETIELGHISLARLKQSQASISK